ncbi:MAG: hypothetical protein ACRDF6_14335, partial [bacterium]
MPRGPWMPATSAPGCASSNDNLILDNIVSGNHDGIALYNGAEGNLVTDNKIGTDWTAMADIGNDAAGINLSHYFTPAGPKRNTISSNII